MIGGDGINDESNKTAPPPTVDANLQKHNVRESIDHYLKGKSLPIRGAWIEIKSNSTNRAKPPWSLPIWGAWVPMPD